MVYHSLHHFNKEFIQTELKRGKKEFKSNFLVALGTIATGIHGTEPKISLKQLEQDLETVKRCGIKEAVLFRLGGLDRRYAKVLRKFV